MKICIIGGGPAGMMAGITASKNKNNQVIIFEKNEKLGKKLFITGKGRCNVTNNCDILDFYKNIVSNPKFMYSSFDRFNNKNLIDFFEENGLHLKVERGNRVFPISDKAYDVTDCLKRILKKQNVDVQLNKEVVSIKKYYNENNFLINEYENQNKIKKQKFNKKQIDMAFDKNDERESIIINVRDANTKEIRTIKCDKVIVATGGYSYQSTGSTGDGYNFAKNFGININDIEPSLVPIKVKEILECKILNGLTLKNVAIKVYDSKNSKKIIYNDFGEMNFHERGLAGPMVLSASCYLCNNVVKDKNIIISIDLKPSITVEELDKRILNEIENNKKMKIYDLLKKLLPNIMINVFLDRLCNICNFDKNLIISNMSKNNRHEIIELLKNYNFEFDGKCGFDEAIITKGGVDIKEINPKTMESKKVKNIYFAGEVLDVDCLTGGYNLQIAWTTGFVAGLDID